MNIVTQKITAFLLSARMSGSLSVFHALALEALIIGYLFFIGLFTIETLLPTFITVRFSLTKLLFVLVAATMLTSLLSHFLFARFPITWNLKNPLLWIGLLWGIGILTVSLIKYPIAFIPVLIALFLASGYLFWQIFLNEK